MSKTAIEWVRNSDGTQGRSLNPVKGLCPVNCRDNQGKPYCYARKLYKRFKWNPEIRYDHDAFKGLPSKPSRVFVGSTMELFGPWVERDWWHMIMAKCLSRPQHTFIFLTKKPQNLPKKFPDNCWVGVSATDDVKFQYATSHLAGIKAKVKFISIEPLLSWDMGVGCMAGYLKERGIGWLIVGQQTPHNKNTEPKIEWIKEIVEAADKAWIAVFLKDNLRPILSSKYGKYPPAWAYSQGGLRQELPQ